MGGRIKLGSLWLRVEDLPDVTPNRAKYEPFESYGGIYQVKLLTNEMKEVQFRTSINKDRENLLKALNGKSVLASSDLFNPFQCVIAAQKYSIDSGEKYAVYDITLAEDKSVPK
jgi:hypothetical protein